MSRWSNGRSLLLEAGFRLGQLGWNSVDRLRYGTGRTPARAPVNVSSGGVLLPGEADGFESLRSVYEGQLPGERERLIQRADDVCAHRFDLLGYSQLSFEKDGQIDWHFDPVHEARVPRAWWQRLSNPGRLGGADPKIIWELNRHQHLVTLAQAAVVTGNDRYRKEIVAQLSCWLDANPPKFGLNWSSSLELALRSISWIWVWVLCGREKALGEVKDRLLSTLQIQAEHIERNMSVFFSPNTHLSGEALALYYLGTALPDMPGARRRRDVGRRWLMRCLADHVLDDGGYMERTLWYHRYATDIFLHFFLLGRRSGDAKLEGTAEKLEKLGLFMAAALQPDGKLPLIGDDDGGRLLPLDGLPGDDPRGLLSALAIVLGNPGIAGPAGISPEEPLWLLGASEAMSFQTPATAPRSKTSSVFPQTGYVFIRSDWTEGALYLSFDCGPHGWLNGGHAHADALSFQLRSGGESIVADPGTYSYRAPWRDRFRGAESHAVLMVDRGYPAVPAGAFHWSRTPEGRFLGLHEGERHVCAAGEIDAGAWRHLREIHFIRPDIVLVLDAVAVVGSHEIEVLFPLGDTDWEVSGGVCRSRRAGRTCAVQWSPGGDFSAELKPGWRSDRYGRRVPTSVLSFRASLETSACVGTLFDLSADGRSIRRQEGQEGTSFFIVRTRDGKELAEVHCTGGRGRVCAASAE